MQKDAGFSGLEWYLESYLDTQGKLTPTLPGSQVTAEFGVDSTLSGSAGCNRYTGGYVMEGTRLDVGPLASTMMACVDPPGLMEQETAYLKLLESAQAFRLSENKLELLGDGGDVILVFTNTPQAAAELPSSTIDAPASLSLDGLKNAVYRLDMTESGVVELQDGVYSEPAAPGSASQNSVSLSEWVAYGLLPDGQTAAAVILVSSGGGSGTFYHLALMADASGQPVNLATTFLGDRVIIHDLGFENDKMVVELTRQGPEDAMCCPTQRVREAYAYQDGELDKISSEEMAGPSLTSVVWRWAEFQSSDDTLVKPDNPEAYTVEFLPDGVLSVRADCNQAGGTYTVDGSQITLQIQTTTMAACPPGSLSEKFLGYLNDVVSYVFMDGDLYLALKFDAGILKLMP
jgi:heat shock protein HslJ